MEKIMNGGDHPWWEVAAETLEALRAADCLGMRKDKIEAAISAIQKAKAKSGYTQKEQEVLAELKIKQALLSEIDEYIAEEALSLRMVHGRKKQKQPK